MQMTEERASRKIKPTVLDIFCGAGGMSLGFKNAGCQILGGIDQNRYAIATHHQNFPSAKLKLPPQDIRDLQNLDNFGIALDAVDILVGEPPCQVLSWVGIGKMRKLERDIESEHDFCVGICKIQESQKGISNVRFATKSHAFHNAKYSSTSHWYECYRIMVHRSSYLHHYPH